MRGSCSAALMAMAGRSTPRCAACAAALRHSAFSSSGAGCHGGGPCQQV